MSVEIIAIGSAPARIIGFACRACSAGYPITIGIAGGSGAGKSYLADILVRETGGVRLGLDNYYCGLPYVQDDNFDRPEAIDFPLFREHLSALRRGEAVDRPEYDYSRSVRSGFTRFEPAGYIIVDGLFPWVGEGMEPLFACRVFVDAPEHVRLTRRLARDTARRGLDEEAVHERWQKTVLPMHRKFVEPLKKSAHLVVANS